MPELGPYGSVRGALSNGRPYRDSGAPVSYNSRAIHTAFTRRDPFTIVTRLLLITSANQRVQGSSPCALTTAFSSY
jgi:hypothetical protein